MSDDGYSLEIRKKKDGFSRQRLSDQGRQPAWGAGIQKNNFGQHDILHAAGSGIILSIIILLPSRN
jgi:hypothetical protein